jgi:hypothetical protein
MKVLTAGLLENPLGIEIIAAMQKLGKFQYLPI